MGPWSQIDSHLVYRGDCVEVMRDMADASIDIVCTSPPYNLKVKYADYDDDLPEEAYLDWFEGVAREMRRVLRPDGSLFLNIGGSATKPWLPFSLPLRLRGLFALQNHIAWVKSVTVGERTHGHFKPVRSERFLNQTHETVLHLTPSGSTPIDRLGIGAPFADKSNIKRRGHAADLRCRGNSWFIPYDTVQSREGKFHHAAAFPLGLARTCIRLHRGRPAVVLDPFMGTGTTLVAAAIEGCVGVGIDLSLEYCAVATGRLREAA